MNMKKIALTLCLAFAAFIGTQAQNVCYIDTEEILATVPDYQKVQDQLNKLADSYRSTIEKDLEAVDKLYKDYQSKRQHSLHLSVRDSKKKSFQRKRPSRPNRALTSAKTV